MHLAALYNVLDNTIVLLKLAMAAADGDTPEFYNILNNDNVSGLLLSSNLNENYILVLTTIIVNQEALAAYILDEQMPEHNSVCDYNLKVFAGPAETTLLPVGYHAFT